MNFIIEFDATQYYKGENPYSLIYKKPYDNDNQYNPIGSFPQISTFDVLVGWFDQEESAIAFAKTLKGKIGRKVMLTV